MDVELSSAYEIVEDMLNFICEEDILVLCGIPRTYEECKMEAVKFARSRTSINEIPGCIMALDGITIPIQKPLFSFNPLSLYTRK